MSALTSCLTPLIRFFCHPEDQTFSERLKRIQAGVINALTSFGPALSVGYSATFKGKEMALDSLLAVSAVFFILPNSERKEKHPSFQAMKIGIYTIGIGLTTMLHMTSVAGEVYEQRQFIHQGAALEAGGRVLTIVIAMKNTLTMIEGDSTRKERLRKSLICLVPTAVCIGSFLTTISSFAMQRVGGTAFDQMDRMIEYQLVGTISSLAGTYLFHKRVIEPFIANPSHLLKWIG